MKKLKTAIASLLVGILVSSMFLAGCTPNNSDNNNVTSGSELKTEHPFSFDCDPTGNDITSFADNDTAGMLLAANPFYAGAQPIPGGNSSDYDKARAAKVSEVIKEADKLVKNCTAVEPQMENIRNYYLDYLTTAFKAEPKLEDYAKQSFMQISLLKSKEQIIKSEYMSVTKKGVSNKLTISMLDYLRVVKALELGGLYLQDAESIGKYASLAIEAASKHSNPSIKSAAKSLDTNMKSLDKIKNNLSDIVVSTEKIDYGLKQLKTGDYYLAREAIAFMKKEMPGIKKKVDSLVPNKQLTKEDIESIKANVSFFEKAQKVLDKELGAIKKSELIDPVESRNEAAGLFTESIAYADASKSDYKTAYESITSPAKGKAPEKGYFEQGWNGIKSVVHGAQTAAGYTVDILGAVTGSISSLGIGLYRGSSASDICNDAAQAWIEVADNYDKSLSGSSTFRAADKYLEDFEKETGELAGGAVKGTIGEGWTSWATTAITKATASMFTGIGKGVVKLADRNADASQIVQGLLELGLSFVGGSKSVVKLSQMPGALQTLKQEGILAGRSSLAFIRQLFNGLDKKFITKEIKTLLTKNNATTKEAILLVCNLAELETKQATIAALQATRQQMLQQMTEIIKLGGKQALQASREGIKESLDDLLVKSFTANMSGVKSALLSVVGNNIKSYLDNLVGTWLDDYIKDLIKEAMESTPTVNEITGKWKGSMTITEVLIKNAQQIPGSELKVGITEPLTLDFAMDADDVSSGSGKVTIISWNPSKPIAATYDNGIISFSLSLNNAVMVFTGDVIRTDTGLSIIGTIAASFEGNPYIKAKWSATK